MKFKSLAVVLLVGTTVSSAFADTNLPFIGTKHFNFDGGTKTEKSITLKKDSTAIVKIYGRALTDIEYKGKFKNPLQIDKDEGYYYFFSKNHVEMLDKNRKPVFKCALAFPNDPTSIVILDEQGNKKCIQELY